MVATPFSRVLGAFAASGVSSVTVTDSIDDESDAIRVSCETSTATGTQKIEVVGLMGWQEGMMWPVGAYILQSVTVTERGEDVLFTSAAFDEEMKKKRTKSYSKLKVKELIAKIAGRHGLTPKCDMEQFLEHVDQKNESDMALLKRYAQKYNAIFNIKNGTLIFLSKSSSALPMFLVLATEAQSWRLFANRKFYYQSVEVKYHDPKTNKTQNVVVGDGDPKYVIEEIQKSKAEAKEIAKAKLERLKAKTRGGTVTLEGQNIVAGGKALLVGFGKADGLYLITQAEHRAAGVFTSTITLEGAV